MRILIVDDHPIVRKGIKLMLSMENNDYEVYEASNVQEAISELRKDDIDLVLADLKLGTESGLEVISKGRAVSKNTKFAILSYYVSEVDFSKGETIGADGYILKDAYVEDIMYAIKTIMRGKKYYDPSIIFYRSQNINNSSISKLTLREKDVLDEMSRGLSNVDIAKKLYLSESTVKKHVSSILNKLNFEHRSQVVYYINRTKDGGVGYNG